MLLEVILYCVPQNVLLLQFMNHVFIIATCSIKEYWCSSLYFWTLFAIATSLNPGHLKTCCHIKLQWTWIGIVVKLIVTMLYGQSVGSYIDVLDQRSLHVSESNSVCQKMMLVTIGLGEISVPTAFRRE